MNVKMFGEICDAFGPSGFEEDVIRTVAKYCKGLELVRSIIEEVYQNTGDVDVKSYLRGRKRRRQV